MAVGQYRRVSYLIFCIKVIDRGWYAPFRQDIQSFRRALVYYRNRSRIAEAATCTFHHESVYQIGTARAWLPDSCTFHIEAVYQIGTRNIRVSDRILRVIDRGKVRENLMQNIK